MLLLLSVGWTVGFAMGTHHQNRTQIRNSQLHKLHNRQQGNKGGMPHGDGRQFGPRFAPPGRSHQPLPSLPAPTPTPTPSKTR